MRRALSKSVSKRKFRNASGYTRAINVKPQVMRGGFRL